MYSIGGVSFLKRKRLVINNNSGGALTGFQVGLTVTYAAAMQAAFGDIRFAYPNGTNIPYWIESKTDSTTAAVWVKVNLPNYGTTPTGDNIIYMYYGNTAATTASSGVNTFVFFDNFAGTSLDTGKWTAYTRNGTLSQNNQLIMYVNSATSHTGAGVAANSALSAGSYILEATLKEVTVWGEGEPGVYIGLVSKAVRDNTYYGGWDYDGASVSANLFTFTTGGDRLWVNYYPAESRGAIASTAVYANVDVKVKLTYINSTTTIVGQFKYSGNTYEYTTVGAAAISPLYPAIHYGSHKTVNYGYANDFRVRLYAATEPTATFGSEEHSRKGGVVIY